VEVENRENREKKPCKNRPPVEGWNKPGVPDSKLENESIAARIEKNGESLSENMVKPKVKRKFCTLGTTTHTMIK